MREIPNHLIMAMFSNHTKVQFQFRQITFFSPSLVTPLFLPVDNHPALNKCNPRYGLTHIHNPGVTSDPRSYLLLIGSLSRQQCFPALWRLHQGCKVRMQMPTWSSTRRTVMAKKAVLKRHKATERMQRLWTRGKGFHSVSRKQSVQMLNIH